MDLDDPEFKEIPREQKSLNLECVMIADSSQDFNWQDISVLNENQADKDESHNQIKELTNTINDLKTEFEETSKLLDEEKHKNNDLLNENLNLARAYSIIQDQMLSFFNDKLAESNGILAQETEFQMQLNKILESNDEIRAKIKELANLQESSKQRSVCSEHSTKAKSETIKQLREELKTIHAQLKRGKQ